MAFVGGLVGYLGLFVLLALSMTLAARWVGRLVGIAQFRWFDSRATAADGWREAAVRLAAVVAPWCLSVLLFFVQLTATGSVAPRGGTYVEVLDGPAKAAGMRDGDRVVSVGTELVSSWDQLRSVVLRQTNPVDIEIERDGRKQVLLVAPREGRIGVTSQTVRQRLGATAAFSQAVQLPWQVVSAAAKSYWRTFRGRETPEVAGPIYIVKETGKAGETGVMTGMLWMLAMLAAYFSPLLAGVVLFELSTGIVFRATYPEARAAASRGFRLARLHQALVLSTSAYVVALPMFALLAADIPVALLLLLWIMPAFCAGYPLIAIAGSAVCSRSSALLCLLAAMFVPCVLLLVSLGLLSSLKAALKNEGFRFGLLRSEPPKAGREATS